MDELIKVMKVAFATEYTFYLKAHFFHWNVEGPNFYQYHKLFGDIYEEVFDSIDNFAENIRKLGSYTPGSYTRFSALSKIDEELQVAPAESMISELLADSNRCVELFKYAFEVSEREKQHGLSDFIAMRMDAHQKHSWMLRSSLK